MLTAASVTWGKALSEETLARLVDCNWMEKNSRNSGVSRAYRRLRTAVVETPCFPRRHVKVVVHEELVAHFLHAGRYRTRRAKVTQARSPGR